MQCSNNNYSHHAMDYIPMTYFMISQGVYVFFPEIFS